MASPEEILRKLNIKTDIVLPEEVWVPEDLTIDNIKANNLFPQDKKTGHYANSGVNKFVHRTKRAIHYYYDTIEERNSALKKMAEEIAAVIEENSTLRYNVQLVESQMVDKASYDIAQSNIAELQKQLDSERSLRIKLEEQLAAAKEVEVAQPVLAAPIAIAAPALPVAPTLQGPNLIAPEALAEESLVGDFEAAAEESLVDDFEAPVEESLVDDFEAPVEESLVDSFDDPFGDEVAPEVDSFQITLDDDYDDDENTDFDFEDDEDPFGDLDLDLEEEAVLSSALNELGTDEISEEEALARGIDLNKRAKRTHYDEVGQVDMTMRTQINPEDL